MASREFRVIGHDTPKVDGVDKVTGQARFGADVKVSRALVGKVLRSPHAHARIRRIDVSRAKALPGVAAVITGADLPQVARDGVGPHGAIIPRDYYLAKEVLARDKALFNGHAVAAVAAVSASVAEEALELIDVDYEVLPHVLDPETAMEANAPLLHDDLYPITRDGPGETAGNVAEHLVYARGNVEVGFAEASTVVERSFRTQVVHHGYIEPDTEMAHFHADGAVEVWANTQATYAVREDLALLLDIPVGRIRVTPTEVGGAFGGKESARVAALCVALSRKAGQPVRITLGRDEVLRATGPGNATVSTVKIGAGADGAIAAIQARLVYDAGATPGAPLRSAIRRVFSHYRTPNLRIDAYDVVTNKPHVAAYRAPGATPTAFAVDSVVDELAESLDMDPLEFRLRNVSRPGDPMPDGAQLPSVSLVEVLNEVKQHPCWTTPLKGPHRGRGLAVGMWTMPGGTTSCHVVLNSDASVSLVLGNPDLSATRTSLAMVAAEALGIESADVRVAMGDTSTVAHSDASAGDKITFVTSEAVLAATHDLLTKLKGRVANEIQVSPEDVAYADGRFWAEGVPEMNVSLVELALRSVRGDGALTGYGSVSRIPGDAAIAPNAAAHVADVEVDPETGKVTILSYTTFQDAGLSINPAQVEGQMQGGATQSIGWALSEAYDYDDSGALLNATLLDYRMQTAADVPFIGTRVLEVPSGDHPLGVRAVGQVPIVPGAAAIANAIYSAAGVRMRELPMTPERVYWAMQEAAEKAE